MLRRGLVCLAHRVVVSILTQHSGWVLLPEPRLPVGAPAVSILTQHSGWVLRCRPLLSALATCVSILTQHSGWVLHLPGQPPVTCPKVSILTQHSGWVLLLLDVADGCRIAVSILTQHSGWVLRWGRRLRRCATTSFNPHPAQRLGAAAPVDQQLKLAQFQSSPSTAAGCCFYCADVESSRFPFQSSPSTAAGCCQNGTARSRRPGVSILTQHSGWVLPQRPSRSCSA